MNIRAWRWYLALILAAVAGYFLTPNDSWTQTIYAELVGLMATGAILAGVVKHRPAAKAAWWWFAAGQLLNIFGTLAEAVIGRVLYLETWPSIADVLWLGLIRHSWLGSCYSSADAAKATTGAAWSTPPPSPPDSACSPGCS